MANDLNENKDNLPLIKFLVDSGATEHLTNSKLFFKTIALL